jgi:hypothetical protein
MGFALDMAHPATLPDHRLQQRFEAIGNIEHILPSHRHIMSARKRKLNLALRVED